MNTQQIYNLTQDKRRAMPTSHSSKHKQIHDIMPKVAQKPRKQPQSDDLVASSTVGNHSVLVSSLSLSTEAAYSRTLAAARLELSTTERKLSRIVHTPALENLGNLLDTGRIISPFQLAGAGILGAFVTLMLIILSRYVNYALSGSEVIGAIALGWILGMLATPLFPSHKQ